MNRNNINVESHIESQISAIEVELQRRINPAKTFKHEPKRNGKSCNPKPGNRPPNTGWGKSFVQIAFEDLRPIKSLPREFHNMN